MADLILRPYQDALMDGVQAAWATERRVICWLPTGGGKTELAAKIAQDEATRGGMTLFVVDRKVLAGQAAARFQKYGMLTGLLRGEDSFVRGYEPVVVASVQTIAARAKHREVQSTLRRVSVVIVDEAHIRFRHHDTLEHAMPQARILGLSATPLRDGLGKAFDRLVRGPSYNWMIEQGYLVKPRYFVPHLDRVKAGLASVGVQSTGDFKPEDLSRLMREKAIIGDLVSTWQAKAEDRPTIVFCVDIAHSKETCDAFRLAGVAAEHIDFHTTEDERRAIFCRFRTGKTRVLCSVVVLAIGFDEPSASCAVLARPTLSLALHIQQIGRAMRVFEGKADCLILDHAGNVLRHGRVEDFEPPELRDLNRNSDRKKRTAGESDFFPCPECKALMSPGQRVCHECGHEIQRPNRVHFVPGELTEAPEDTSPQVPIEEVRDTYLEVLSYARARGKKEGWAFFVIRDHFGIKAPLAWKNLPERPPSVRTMNLIRSRNIAYAKRAAKQRRMAG